MKRTTELPEGVTDEQIQQIIEYYENQSDEDAAEDLETAWANTHGETLLSVPGPLVPAVEALILAYEAARDAVREQAEDEPPGQTREAS